MARKTPSLRIALPVAIAALVLVLVPAALAAQGGNGGKGGSSGNLTLALINSTDGLPHWGQQVTFNLTTTASNPFVNVRCYQGSAFVYDGWRGFAPGAMDYGQPFTLSSPYWTGGDADCTARLVVYTNRGSQQTLATLGFHTYA